MNLGCEDGYRGVQPPRGAGLPNERRPVLERGAGYLDFGGLGVASKKGEQAKQVTAGKTRMRIIKI